MSTTTTSAHAAVSGSGLSFTGVLRSEWIKFRSLRSTKLLLLFTFLAVVGVGTMAAWVQGISIESIMQFGMGDPTQPAVEGAPAMSVTEAAAVMGVNLYAIPNAGLQIGILILGALSVLLVASEFGTGMIRSTMTAIPKRIPAFAAKAVVLVIVSYVLTVLAALVTTLLALPIYSSYGIDISFGTEGVIYSILMGGLYVAGVALIGLSLGTLLRSSAGGIIVLVVVFFLLDFGSQLLSMIPGEFWKYVNQYVPSVAGGRMLEINDKVAFISPLSGALIFVGWILVFMIPALISLKKRDV